MVDRLLLLVLWTFFLFSFVPPSCPSSLLAAAHSTQDKALLSSSSFSASSSSSKTLRTNEPANEQRLAFLTQERFAARMAGKQMLAATDDNTDHVLDSMLAAKDSQMALASATGGASTGGATGESGESEEESQTGSADVASNAGSAQNTAATTENKNDAAAPGGGATEVTAAITCEVGDWSDWSSCSRKCAMTDSATGDAAKGIQTRSRAVLNVVKLDLEEIKRCPTLIETQVCYPPPCPMDCRVSNWTEWNGCVQSCEDTNVQSRTRTVQAIANYGGQECPVLEEHKLCNTTKCPPPVANCSGALQDCSEHGACTLEGCECYPGYAGVDCSGKRLLSSSSLPLPLPLPPLMLMLEVPL